MDLCLEGTHVIDPIQNGARCRTCGKEWHWDSYLKVHTITEPKKPKPWNAKPHLMQ